MIPEVRIRKPHLQGQRVARRGRRAARKLTISIPAVLADSLLHIASLRELTPEQYAAEVLDAHIAGLRIGAAL